ncbi:hypothetical protein MMC25_000718 [Agyrium rufum]|nr:hypothetical protein [Agyrium rufum]
MHSRTLFPASLALGLAAAQQGSSSNETVLGVYIFSRHGDRTSKSTPPTTITDLGYAQVFSSGSYFRSRYIASNATNPIANISPDLFKNSQLTASAPLDDVLFPSTIGFLQGLYPPVGSDLGSQKLRNGSTIESPLNGYQLIPVATVASGTGSENQAWLQGSSNCANAISSSNDYYFSPEYLSLLSSTGTFYTNLTPVINSTFTDSQISFKNAYSIFDYINVAEIHNATIPSSDLLDEATLLQIRTLSDTHEYNLAFNASSPVRAITGSVLAAQILQALNATVVSSGKTTPLNIQFGAYGGMQSLFGQLALPQQNPDFYGVPDYATTLTFELFTTAAVNTASVAAEQASFPADEDLQVRFLFHNGTTNSSSPPVTYPLFGGSAESVSWMDFVKGISAFAVSDQGEWCRACGNSTGVCAAYAPASSPNSSAPAASAGGSSSSSGGVSKAVAGVIGAMVTLAVVLGLQALILLVAGLRVVSKKRGGSSGVGIPAGEK